jgi:hypothetical protein
MESATASRKQSRTYTLYANERTKLSYLSTLASRKRSPTLMQSVMQKDGMTTQRYPTYAMHSAAR